MYIVVDELRYELLKAMEGIDLELFSTRPEEGIVEVVRKDKLYRRVMETEGAMGIVLSGWVNKPSYRLKGRIYVSFQSFSVSPIACTPTTKKSTSLSTASDPASSTPLFISFQMKTNSFMPKLPYPGTTSSSMRTYLSQLRGTTRTRSTYSGSSTVPRPPQSTTCSSMTSNCKKRSSRSFSLRRCLSFHYRRLWYLYTSRLLKGKDTS
jgi:hypothetical protein